MPQESDGRPDDGPAFDPTRRKIAGWASILFGMFFGAAAVVILGSELVYKIGCIFGFIEHVHADDVAQCGPVWGLGRSAMYSIGLGIASGVFFLGETSPAGRKLLGGLADRLSGWFGK